MRLGKVVEVTFEEQDEVPTYLPLSEPEPEPAPAPAEPEPVEVETC